MAVDLISEIRGRAYKECRMDDLGYILGISGNQEFRVVKVSENYDSGELRVWVAEDEEFFDSVRLRLGGCDTVPVPSAGYELIHVEQRGELSEYYFVRLGMTIEEFMDKYYHSSMIPDGTVIEYAWDGLLYRATIGVTTLTMLDVSVERKSVLVEWRCEPDDAGINSYISTIDDWDINTFMYEVFDLSGDDLREHKKDELTIKYE